MNTDKIYYQPNLSDEEWGQKNIFSFEVYHTKEAAQKDFPGAEINTYSGDDIENPHFRDTDDYVENMTQKIIAKKDSLKQMLLTTIEAVIYHKTSEEHTFIELDKPLEFTSKSKIARIYRDGGLSITFSNGLKNENLTINDLNSDEMCALLLQLNSNNDIEEEIA